MEQNKKTAISLSDLLNIFTKRWLVLLIAFLVGIGAGVATSFMTYRPVYSTEVVYLVNYDGDFGSSSDITNANNGYIVVSRVLPNCIAVVSQNKYYSEVAKKFNASNSQSKGVGELTAKHVKSAISYSFTELTTEIHIDIMTANAQLSYDIASAVAATFPEYIKNNYPLTETSSLSCSLINIPEKAVAPSNGRGLVAMALGFGAGALALAYVVCLIIVIVDDRIKSVAQLTDAYSVPVMATVPSFDNEEDFATVEAFRSLMINTKFVVPEKDVANVICVSSACPSEGKTTVVANYAKACANAGNKVIVLDCDLRKPKILEYFGIEKNVGLGEHLSGNANFEDVVVRNVVENLDVIGCGKIVPNPIVIFNSQAFKSLLEKLSKLYDYVILDTPPLGVVSDTLVLLPNTDGVLVVVSEGVCTNKALASVMQGISRTGSSMLGFVYNGVKANKNSYYSYSV